MAARAPDPLSTGALARDSLYFVVHRPVRALRWVVGTAILVGATATVVPALAVAGLAKRYVLPPDA